MLVRSSRILVREDPYVLKNDCTCIVIATHDDAEDYAKLSFKEFIEVAYPDALDAFSDMVASILADRPAPGFYIEIDNSAAIPAA